jgi:hypothetical protein
MVWQGTRRTLISCFHERHENAKTEVNMEELNTRVCHEIKSGNLSKNKLQAIRLGPLYEKLCTNTFGMITFFLHAAKHSDGAYKHFAGTCCLHLLQISALKIP